MLINNAFINVNRYLAEENIATVIITHGLAEHSQRFDSVAKTIVESGYNVVTYDIRGHGKSQGKRGSIKNYKLFIEDLNAIVKKEKKYNKNIFLMGHSMGGIITNLYLLEYGNVEGAIIIASPLDLIIKPTFLNRMTLKFFGFKKMRTNFADKKLSHNAHNLNDPLNLKYFRLDLMYQTMIRGLSKLSNNFDKLKTPMLFQYGKEDLIVKSDIAQKKYELIGSKDKTMIVYEKSKHDLLHDIENDKVISDIINWLNEKSKQKENGHELEFK